MIYSGTTKAKSGEDIPLFASGKPMHSKYNPQGEAEAFAASIKGEGAAFLLIAGIGAAFHIASALKRFPGAFVLALEADSESLAFCSQFPAVKEILQSPSVVTCTASDAPRLLRKHYVPALHGGCVFVCQRAWENENSALLSRTKEQITDELRKISADYSVQAHFGGQWQRNILENLSAFTQNPKLHLDTGRRAAVIAAGPSLDRSVKTLLQQRDSYCIISTDTALGTLARNGIAPDAIVSIDAQKVSATHFFALPLLQSRECVCVFDICSNRSAVAYARLLGFPVYFIRSAHPLASLALEGTTVPLTESGSGTVTIAACDFARLNGFREIELFGADFCYSDGKPYAQGTYLEPNFLSACKRLLSQEQMNAALMFRTELKKTDGKTQFSGTLKNALTTEVLEGYERTTLEWAERWGYKKNGSILSHSPLNPQRHESGAEFRFKDFFEDFLKNLQKTVGEEEQKLNRYTVSLLPLIANIRKKQGDCAKHSFFDFLKLAYSQLTRYTVLYE